MLVGRAGGGEGGTVGRETKMSSSDNSNKVRNRPHVGSKSPLFTFKPRGWSTVKTVNGAHLRPLVIYNLAKKAIGEWVIVNISRYFTTKRNKRTAPFKSPNRRQKIEIDMWGRRAVWTPFCWWSCASRATDIRVVFNSFQLLNLAAALGSGHLTRIRFLQSSKTPTEHSSSTAVARRFFIFHASHWSDWRYLPGLLTWLGAYWFAELEAGSGGTTLRLWRLL